MILHTRILLCYLDKNKLIMTLRYFSLLHLPTFSFGKPCVVLTGPKRPTATEK